jgi:MATE family multidrug resistance protein
MGMSLFFESSIFSAVSLLMASLFSTVTVAAHQVALSFTSLIFMVPLSISIALTIVVAFEVGGGYLEGAKAYTRLGVASAMGILGVASIGIFLLREPIAYIYTTNEEVVQLAAQFFLFAIVYQISDAAQASLQGVLRGYKDVTVPFFTALVSYWALGLPAGYLLAVTTPLGPFGLWLGITVGLTSAAIGFFIRLKIVVKRHERGFNVS